MSVGQTTVDRIAPDRSAPPAVADVLERYLADLENGTAPSREALLAAHPDLAGELAPYLDGLLMVHGAALNLRAAGAARNGGGLIAADGGTRQLGDFRIVREIGRGGMGIVYEAHQKSLNRRVALKILPFAAVLDERQIARFRNEAQAAAQLHHPHIVPVFAVGQEQGLHYYAMQYIDGQTLEEAIGELRRLAERPGEFSTKACGGLNGTTVTLPAAGPLSTLQSVRESEFIRSVARLGKQAAEALAHAHECGVIHRDVKPSNLLVDHRGKLWVTDFGLARIQSDSGVTLTGDVVGTLRYMSPEQASGRAALIDGRTDVYSLGVTLYELLTLRPAFPGDDRQRLLQSIERDEPTPTRQLNPAVPVDLETIILEAMAKPREERYASAQALADDLDRFLAGKPTLARRPTFIDRAAKWARRHRSLVAMAAASAAVLCVLSTVGVVLLAREQARTRSALAAAEKNAVAARENFERAERNFRQARLVVDQFGVRLADRLADLQGTDTVRHERLIIAKRIG